MSCPFCNDTGSLSRSLDGMLDCAHCDVADERMRLDAWVERQSETISMSALYWLIYQHGKVAAQSETPA